MQTQKRYWLRGGQIAAFASFFLLIPLFVMGLNGTIFHIPYSIMTIVAIFALPSMFLQPIAAYFNFGIGLGATSHGELIAGLLFGYSLSYIFSIAFGILIGFLYGKIKSRKLLGSRSDQKVL
jgi:hypothetical protein